MRTSIAIFIVALLLPAVSLAVGQESSTGLRSVASAPRIVLDMEFHHRGINVFFRLLLENDEAGVEIDYLSFGSGADRNPDENTRRLLEALADARIEPASAMQRLRETAGLEGSW